MANVRLGGLFLDVRQRNQQFVRAATQNVQALRNQQRAVRTLQRQLRGFNARVRNTVSALFSFRGILTTIAGGGVFGAVIRQQTRFGAALVETSRQIGLTIEQMQLFRRAAEGDGIAIAEFDRAIRDFTRRLGEAAAGTGESLQAYRDYGIAIEDATGRTRESYDVIEDVADVLAGMTSQAERAALAYDIFGRQGIRLLPILQQGSDALNANLDSFRQFGLVSREQAEILKALEQSYTDLANIIQTSMAQAVAEAAGDINQFNIALGQRLPAVLEGAIGLFVRLINNLELVGLGFATFFASFAIARFTPLLLAMRTLISSMGILAGSMAAVGTVATAMWSRVLLPALVVLGFAELIQILHQIREQARLTQTGFLDLAVVVGSTVVAALAEALLNIPATLEGILVYVTTALGEAFYQIGQAVFNAFLAPFRGQSITDAITESIDFGKIFSDALDGYMRSFEALSVDIDGSALARILGVDENSLEKSESIVTDAISGSLARIQAITDLFRVDVPVEFDVPELDIGQLTSIGEGTGSREDSAAFELRLGQALEEQVGIRDRILDRQRAELDAMVEKTRLIGVEGAERVRLESGLRLESELQTEILRLTRNREQAQRNLDRAIASGIGVQEAQDLWIIADEAFHSFHELADGIREASDAITEDLVRATEEFQRRSRLEEIANNARDAFARFGEDVLINFNDIGDAARALGREIVNSLIRTLIINPIANSFGSAIGGLIGLQSGGTAFAGNPYIVGEAGPELFIPESTGTVVPNHDLGGFGGRNVFNFSPTIQSSDTAAVNQALAEAFPVFESRVINRIQVDSTRNSSLRRSIRG